METKKVLTIVFSLLAIFILGFAVSWSIINFNKVKDSMSGTELYTNEDLKKSYQDGYDTALKDKDEYDELINNYRDMITELNDNISALNSQIASLNTSNRDYQNQVDKLNNQKADLISQIDELRTNKNQNETTINALNKQIAGLNAEISSLNNIIGTNENTINELNNQIAGLNNQIVGLNQTISTNEQTVSDLRININELNSRIEELSKDKDKNANTITLLNNEIATLNEQIDALNKLNEDYTATIIKLNGEIDTLKAEKNNLIIENTNYFNSISSLNNQVVNLQTINAQLESTNTLHLNTITNLNSQIASLNAQISDITLQSQNSSSTISALNSKIAELQESVAYYENYIANLETGDQIVVTFEFDGSVYNIQMVNKGSKLSVTTPTSTDYAIFNSWQVAGIDIDLDTHTFNENTRVVADVTYRYDAIFKVDNAIYDSQIITKGEFATLPTNPTKSGYEFDGWSTDGVNVINVSTIPMNSTTTYHAVFTKLHNVSFVYEDVFKSNQVIRNGQYANNVTIENTEYKVFNGWKVNGTIVNVNDYKIVNDTTFVADITYKHDVIYKVDGETYNTQIVATNNYPSVPANPLKDGYEFDGWSIDGTTLVNTATIAITGNTMYQAVFTKLYNVTFVYEGATISTQQVRVNSTAKGITINSTPYKVFNGWLVNGELVDVNEYEITQDTEFTASLVYKHDVTFKVDEDVYNTQIVANNTMATVPNEPTKEGYAFDGWSTNGVSIVDVASYPITGNEVFIAMFTKVYEVSFYHGEQVLAVERIRENYYAVDPGVSFGPYDIFNNWLLNGEVVDLATYPITENTSFVADVTYRYEVSFIADDEQLGSEIVTKDEFATFSAQPTKYDNEFLGWSVDGENVVDIATHPITENTTYIAVFTLAYGLRNHLTGEMIKPWKEFISEKYLTINSVGYLMRGDKGSAIEDIIIGDMYLPQDGSIKMIGSDCFKACALMTGVNIPDGVTTIYKYAFFHCTSLTSIVIPSSVTEIATSAFAYATTIAEVYNLSTLDIVAGSTTNGDVARYAKVIHTDKKAPSLLIERDGVAYYPESDISYIALTLKDFSLKNVVLHENTTRIEENAFYLSDIYSVDVSNCINLTVIGSSAFTNCFSLCEIDLRNNINLTTIESSAFWHCRHLTSIVIPQNVTDIKGMAFSDCNLLYEIYNLSSLTITVGDATNNGDIGEYAKIVHTDINELSVLMKENGVVYYNDGTELIAIGIYDADLTDLILNENTTRIEDYAFRDLKNIEIVDLSNCSKLSYIGIEAFYRAGVREFIVSPSITTIRRYAFSYNPDLVSIDLENTQITTLDQYTFAGCTSLEHLALPSTIKSFGTGTFNGCTGLKSIYIPISVTRIYADAKTYSPFLNCKSTLKIYCEATSKGSEWDTYWKHYSDTSYLTAYYGYTYEQYLTAVGLQ